MFRYTVDRLLPFLFAWSAIASGQVITTAAGGGWRPFPSSTPALGAPVAAPSIPASDGHGNLYFADSYSNVVLKLSSNGTLTVVAGNGNAGYSGDGGPATVGSLNSPSGVAVDAAGNLYIADSSNNCIRKVSGGILSTFAGTSSPGFSGDGGPAVSALLYNPFSVAVDGAGNVYIADQYNHRVREVSGGIIKTVAGNGSASYSGDGGLATSASLNGPHGLALDAAGHLYIADTNNQRVREVNGGTITTIAGNGVAGLSGDGGPATAATLFGPLSVAVDSSGRVFIADYQTSRIRQVSGGIITSIAGGGAAGTFSGDGGPATGASLYNPTGVAVDNDGQLFIADFHNERVRKIAGGIITTVAGGGHGTYFGDGGPAAGAGLFSPYDMAVDAAGNIYIADSLNNCIRKVSGGTITTVAGNGISGFSGDGGPATSASLNTPVGIALDSAGNLYIADSNNQRIRKVSGGIITTVAGTGNGSYSGDGGPATSANLWSPFGVTVDSAGNIYIADTVNNRVRRVSSGIITTVAGNGTGGFSGDGSSAIAAGINEPRKLALDSTGNLYIAEFSSNRIREVSNGTITTVAGNGTAGFSGDGGSATAASISGPQGVAVDAAGNVLIADSNNDRIRKVAGGKITTLIGNGSYAYSGDGGPALSAGLEIPLNVTLDRAGNIYIADSNNNRIREVLSQLPSYQAAPLSLTFSANAGGNLPDAQTVTLSSAVPGLAFSISSNAAWLSATPSSGSIPTSLQVQADSTNLANGTYQGMLTISTPNATPPTTTISVQLTIGPQAPAQLSVSPQILSFTAVQSTAPQTAQLQVSNSGGGSLTFAAVTSGGAWLLLSQTSGTATPSSPASLTVTADPGSLSPGTYTGGVTITSGGTTSQVGVTLSVSAPTATILLSQTGLSFTTAAQGGAPLPQAFGVLNTGQGSMDWTATATTLSGNSSWLVISATSGTVAQPFVDISMINVSIDTTGLTAGTYYGRIAVSAVALNTPQILTVVLTVLPAGTTPPPEVRPTGLIFTGVAGQSPGSQDVMLGNPKVVTDKYLSASIGNSFTFLPASADLLPNQPATLRVFPDFSHLQPGQIDRGTIALQFSDGTPKTISILTVVASPATTSSGRIGTLAASCGKLNLEIQWRSPTQSFAAVVGQPTTLEVQVIDDCGNLIGPGNPQGASVIATFANKDTNVKLTHIGNGVWTGTWRPVNATPAQENISITAFNAGGSVLQSGQQTLSGTLSTGVTPIVTTGGVVHAASEVPGKPIAPGGLISLFGANLSNATSQASSLPLPQQQNGTQVLLGNLPLPILYTSGGQINVQVPFNTPVNTQYQISVQRDSFLSVPEQLVVAAAQPGIFTVNQQGAGQGVIFKSDGITLAQPGSPATVGETAVIYCTGLGAVSPAVPDGTPAPPAPLSNTVDPVTVTIGGQNATVSFSGLTPGFPGLYQINAVVPNGVSGDAVPVVIGVAGQTSPSVTMAVQ